MWLPSGFWAAKGKATASRTNMLSKNKAILFIPVSLFLYVRCIAGEKRDCRCRIAALGAHSDGKNRRLAVTPAQRFHHKAHLYRDWTGHFLLAPCVVNRNSHVCA